ncbi:hypothetical protein [Terribacillus halophilus]|uniref:hypothetical protein n=1 Tax=Terribacillus halophilus TaxID=361279 RepID=UPI000B878297|nr:hypothetical protein [Terribacillus halophilus]
MIAKIGMTLMMIIGIFPAAGFFTAFFAYETSSKVVLALSHVTLALLYYFFGFWVLAFVYAAFANVS